MLPTPYYERDGITIYCADCRDVFPYLPPVDLVLTDPPYGIDKRERTYQKITGAAAEWDHEFPTWWMEPVSRISDVVAVMPGVVNLVGLPKTIGEMSYRWTLAAHVVNGMTRGAFGYGNWIPCAVYSADGVSLYRQKSDIGRVSIGRNSKPDHPSPKPIEAMRWFVSMLTGDLVLDPFMGSGTTLVASKQAGRQAIGIDIEERYCEIAVKRLQQTVMQFAEVR